MKHNFLLGLLLISMGNGLCQTKSKARLSVQYTSITNGGATVTVSAKYKGERGFEPITRTDFHLYLKLPDTLLHLGVGTTNEKGRTNIPVPEEVDSLDLKTVQIKLENNAFFSDAESELSVRKAVLSARMETSDSLNQISAVLTDAEGQPLAGQALRVQLQRMFAPLPMGEESYTTDERGSILVPITESMPGLDGVLIFEVVLDQSEEYGTIKALVRAPVGIPVTDQSTFDRRTMWSPPSKTPYYLLIFPNLIILGVWVPIFFLFINLYRISKNKTP